MAGSEEQQEEGDGKLLKLIEDGSDTLSREEIDALLATTEDSGNSADVIQELVTDALIAKLVLHRALVRMHGDLPVERWRGYYNPLADKFKSSLCRIIAESDAGFFDGYRKRFVGMGIVTFQDLCLCSVEELGKAGFTDLEIESIQLILHRLELFLMG